MKRLTRFAHSLFVAAALGCVAWPLATATAQDGDDPAFDPARHFPAPALVYFSVESIDDLQAQLKTTLLGQIVTHPGWERACSGLVEGQGLAGGLLEKLREVRRESSGPLVQLTGKTPFELVSLFRGQICGIVRGLSALGTPDVALAVELGPSRADLLDVLARVREVLEARLEQEFLQYDFEGVRVTNWTLPEVNFAQAVVGDHLIVATNPELLQGSIRRFRGEEEATGEEARFVDAATRRALDARGRQVYAVINLEVARAMALALQPDPNVERLVDELGLDHLSSLAVAMGFQDGSARSVVHLGMREGPAGIFQLVRESLPPVENVNEALERIPAAAHQLSALRVRPGHFFSGLDQLARRVSPTAGPELDKAYDQVSGLVGFDLRETLWNLAEIELYSFVVQPPAGSLIPDSIALARTEDLSTYDRAITQMIARLGAPVRRLRTTEGSVNYVHLTMNPETIGQLSGGVGGVLGNDPLFGPIGFALMSPNVTLADCDIGDGWTAISGYPQALWRYLKHYKDAPKLEDEVALASLARRQLRGSSGATVINASGDVFLYVYNTLLALGSLYAGPLQVLGVDLGQAPPAEAFLGSVKPGHVRLDLGEQGFTLRSHRVPVIAGLAAVGAGALAAGFLAPMLETARGEARTVECANNLRQIVLHALVSAEASDRKYLPRDTDEEVSALQKLVDGWDPEVFPSDLKIFKPSHFVCPASQQTPADPDEDGKWKLSENSLSYELVSWRLSPEDAGAILLFDSAPHHDGGRNVAFTDGSVQFFTEEAFQALYEKQKARFGRKDRE